MLKRQREVHEGTVRLSRAEEQRGRNLDNQAERLVKKELHIAGDVEKLIPLVREDGTTVGLLEVLETIHEDMQLVAHRLAESKVDRITQAIEIDIIEHLEEMLAIFDEPGRISS
jgi:hypothetical protein